MSQILSAKLRLVSDTFPGYFKYGRIYLYGFGTFQVYIEQIIPSVKKRVYNWSLVTLGGRFSSDIYGRSGTADNSVSGCLVIIKQWQTEF